ncbi:Dioxygenase [Planctomycetes bacterium Poly30]|uniref:Dioxygenase n=1 Tax=Saltatorellus ferox TaxID=2528018 RepID=A0A518EP82_9BACT|nr:Dioxygenase [Planctomycetes bacterium Poly30]
MMPPTFACRAALLIGLQLVLLTLTPMALAQEDQPRGPGSRVAIETEAAEAIALHPNEVIEGHVIVSPPVPADEELRVVLEAWTAPADSRPLPTSYFDLMHPDAVFETLADVPVDARRRFTLPRIEGAPEGTCFRVRLEGRYTYAEDLLFLLGGEKDPGAEIELGAEVGAWLTLRFLLPEGATEEERASLIGRKVTLVAQERGRHSDSLFEDPTRYESALDQDLAATFGGVADHDLFLVEPDESRAPLVDLAPFFMEPQHRIRLGRGARKTVELPLTRGLELSGTVVDGDGIPLEGAQVSVERPPSDRLLTGRWFTERYLSTKTQADGSFLFRALPPHPEELVVVAAEHLGLRMDAEELAAQGSASPHKIELPPIRLSRGNVLHGRVVFGDGRPAQGTAVHFQTTDPGPGWPPRSALTEADGTFTVNAFRDAPIRVTVDGWREGDAATLTTLSPRDKRRTGKEDSTWPRLTAHAEVRAAETSVEEPVVLRLAPTRLLRGRIVDPAGLPLDDCVLYLGGEWLAAKAWGFEERTSPLGAQTVPFDEATGAFEIRDFPDLDFAVFAQRGRGEHPRSSKLLKLKAWDLPDDVELTLDVLSSASGRVIEAGGAPVAGARILAAKKERFHARPWREAVTDEAGAFDLLDLPEGEYQLTVEHPELVIPEPTLFTALAPGEAGSPLEITVVRGGHVRVDYEPGRGADGQPAKPFLTDLDSRGVGAATQQTHPGYRQVLLGPVLPGRYLATIAYYEESSRTERWLREAVEVRAGETTEITLEKKKAAVHSVEGRAFDRNGAPLTGYSVEIWRGPSKLGATRIDETGSFELSFQGSEAAEARLKFPYPEQRIAERTITPPSQPGGPPLSVDWTVDAGRIVGTMSSDEVFHQSLGTMVEVVPEGEDPGARVPGRSIQVMGGYTSGDGRPVPSRFEIRHLAPGTYTLVAWRRADEDGGDLFKRSQPAAKPLRISLGVGDVREDVVLEVIPPPSTEPR